MLADQSTALNAPPDCDVNCMCGQEDWQVRKAALETLSTLTNALQVR